MEKYKDKEANVYLRPITIDDTELIVSWRNKESVRKNFIYQAPFSIEGHMNWMHNVIETGKAVQMMICRIDNDNPIGSVYIRDIDDLHKKGEFGIFIGDDEARGKGVGTATAKLMVSYAFNQLSLHRLYLRALAENKRAIRSYEKAGFIQEGCLQDDVCINGEYKDIVWMAIVKKETVR